MDCVILILKIQKFHLKHKKIATVTAVRPLLDLVIYE